MRKIVADQLQRSVVVLHCVDRDFRIRFDRPGQIPVRAVDLGADGLFRQGLADAFGHLCGCRPDGDVAGVTIGEGKGDLGHLI